MQNNRASPTPTSVAVLRRRTAVFIITVVVSAPFALFLVVLGLVVVEYVIFPTATLATGVIAALVAGWAASRLAGDGYRTDIGAVAWRNLAWAIIPAAAAALPFEQPRHAAPFYPRGSSNCSLAWPSMSQAKAKPGTAQPPHITGIMCGF